MPTMYELTADYKTVLEMMYDTEIDPQIIADTLESITAEIEVKAENTAIIINELTAEAAKIKAEEQRLNTRRKVYEKRVESLKQGLFDAMKLTGKTKFKTDLFSFNIAKNGGKTPVIVDVDCSELPDDLVTITEKPNLDAIAAYLEKHPESKYGHFGERGESLRIK